MRNGTPKECSVWVIKAVSGRNGWAIKQPSKGSYAEHEVATRSFDSRHAGLD